ncbi:WYL domain-containing protein [Leucobacter allii]|uniref:WYL domain-containing protein n=1 Tax=Leucobacter allii TaxID=2932247 RepID=A0ABY4FQB0_9MICO|nr:WYL domain-containing protein [Leucobacter allii]UOQ58446.1 WYL domain-containing protein [Leucobacter allii]UOR03027.1 WYL domain-containing protein [Leucobacter allii]
MAERSAVPGEQRVFSLVLALIVSPQGLTKRALLSSVYGYADRFRPGEANVALERQFERDKEQLRALGIQIETIDSPQEPGNNQLTRYRISKDRLQFPPELRFSARELVLLRLAALAWSEGSMSAQSRRAAMKLQALGAGFDLQHLGVAPSLGTAEPSAAPLQEAIDAGRAVRFDYTLPDRDAPLARRVAPLRLHRADGRWHLISWDLERDAARVFLLGRISGAVRAERTAFPPALRDEADGIVAELLRLREEQRAVVHVRRGSVAEARLAPRAEPGEPMPGDRAALSLGVLDQHLFAEELIGYGPDAAVVSPPRLRELVVSGLRRIAAAHAARQEDDHA